MTEPRSLIDQAYSAAIEPDGWGGWMTGMIKEFGAVSGSFALLDPVAKTPLRLEVYGAGLNLLEGYRTYWGRYDPQISHALRASAPEAYTDNTLARTEKSEVKAYLDWQRRQGGIGFSLTGTIPIAGSSLLAVFVYHQSASAGYIAAEQRLKLASMLDGIKGAIDLGFAQHRYLLEATWKGLDFDQPLEAAFLLDERGRILHLNARASALLQERDGLSARDGRLVAADSGTAENLTGALRRACHPGDARSGAIRLPRVNGRIPLIALLYPLPEASRPFAPFEAATLLRVVDPAERPSGSRTLYQQAFGLSTRETDLAERLVGGHSIETAAEVLGISIATARIHARRLFQRTGTNRQTDLLRLLMRIG